MDYELEDMLALRKLKEAQILRNSPVAPATQDAGMFKVPNWQGAFERFQQQTRGNRMEDEAVARQRELSLQQNAEVADYNKAVATPGTVFRKTLRQGEGPLMEPNVDEQQFLMSPEQENQRQMALSLDAASRLPKARASATQFVNSGVGFPEKMATLGLQQSLLREQQLSRLQSQKDRDAMLEEGRNTRAENLNLSRMALGQIAAASRAGAKSDSELDRQIKEARLRNLEQGTAAQQKESIAQGARDRMLEEAQINIDLLLKKGGVLDKSTGSGAGRLVDMAANFVGHGTEGAKNAASLAPLTSPILMQVPRFEGPQSDADTRIYKESAGQLADTSLPVSVRMSAAATIKDIMMRRKGQFDVKDSTGAVHSTVKSGPVDFGSLK